MKEYKDMGVEQVHLSVSVLVFLRVEVLAWVLVKKIVRVWARV